MLEGRRSDGFSLKRYLQLVSSFYAIEPIFARFIERSIVGNEPHRFFPPFRLDAPNAQLWRGDQVISLRRKTFDVLLPGRSSRAAGDESGVTRCRLGGSNGQRLDADDLRRGTP
jgi:hypothetical protein